MIEFMDGIVEKVEWFAEQAVKGALITLRILEKIVIVLTTPVWILPYKAIRKNTETAGNKSISEVDYGGF